MGRVAHKQRFKFGHDGLWYMFREGTHAFRDLLLTRDVDTALGFLGYDPQRFAQGFDMLQEIFEYASSSVFFNADIYPLDNRNHRSRVRDRKRKTYMEFLEWAAHLDQAGRLPRFEYAAYADKIAFLPRAFEWFPLFERDYEQTRAGLEASRKVGAKLNGQVVMQLTGRTGGQIAPVMTGLKARHADHSAYAAWVLLASEQEIRETVM
jgi:hypothetical protein